MWQAQAVAYTRRSVQTACVDHAERVINAGVPASCKYQIADTSCSRQRRLSMNSLWRKSASIKEASLTRDVSRLNCYAIPNLRPTTSASEANVEFHNIVAAVGESQLDERNDTRRDAAAHLLLCLSCIHQLNAASVTCGASRATCATLCRSRGSSH